jgi:hypothetical protein
MLWRYCKSPTLILLVIRRLTLLKSAKKCQIHLCTPAACATVYAAYT